MKWILSFLICITAIIITFTGLPLKAALNQLVSPFINLTNTPPSNKRAEITAPISSAFSTPASFPDSKITTTPFNMTTGLIPRLIRTTLLAREQSEGVGAVVRRSIGTPKLRHLTPFLMLDHFSVSPGAGFPDHPHRGQETITYLLSGGVDHEDFAGNKGTIGPGDLQFMTAGRGIMHAEMPRQDMGVNIGMQLWVDLPEKLKSVEPRYRDLRAAEIPIVELDDGKVEVKVISGRSHGVDSVRDLAYTPVWIFDINIKPGGSITQELPTGWNAFAYTLSGLVSFSNGPSEGPSSKTAEAVTPYHNVVFEQAGDVVTASVEEGSTEDARFFLIAGQPLDQEIVQYGPFVQTTKEGVYQAMMDFQTNSNGFERALNWRSEIGKSMAH
jgi:redox-sensitive bicupin YhaK (pirin superfamily)